MSSFTIASPNAVPAVSTYLETIGRTPMVRLSNRTLPKEAIENNVTVLCKIEMQNPGGSLKDRIALNMIESAEKRGEITPGKTTLIDFTSGNTGELLSIKYLRQTNTFLTNNKTKKMATRQ